jgi:hypothetical protein
MTAFQGRNWFLSNLSDAPRRIQFLPGLKPEHMPACARTTSSHPSIPPQQNRPLITLLCGARATAVNMAILATLGAARIRTTHGELQLLALGVIRVAQSRNGCANGHRHVISEKRRVLGIFHSLFATLCMEAQNIRCPQAVTNVGTLFLRFSILADCNLQKT